MIFDHDAPTVVERWVAADPERVYRAWTEPDIVMKWFGHSASDLCSAKIDLRPSGRWQFLLSEDAGFEGEYVVVEPGERLVFTWARIEMGAGGERRTSLHAMVEVSFASEGEGTRVRVVHTSERGGARRGIDDGWIAALWSLSACLA